MTHRLKKHIEYTYWATYVYDVKTEIRMKTNQDITMKEALAEAIHRRNTGVYYNFLQERQKWNLYVQNIHQDMRKTYRGRVGIAEAVAEACKETDLAV